MLENILKDLQCGKISLRPFVVMADETERPLEYTVSVNETAKNCTIFFDGAVFSFALWISPGNQSALRCERA